jgi:hypothetical protein
MPKERGNQAAERENGQCKRKDGSLPGAALDPDLATLPGNQFFADVQSKSKTLACGQRRSCYLIEALKNSLGHIRVDPASRVRNLHEQETRIFLEHLGLNFHGAPVGRKLNGVVEQNEQDLA